MNLDNLYPDDISTLYGSPQEGEYDADKQELVIDKQECKSIVFFFFTEFWRHTMFIAGVKGRPTWVRLTLRGARLTLHVQANNTGKPREAHIWVVSDACLEAKFIIKIIQRC